MSLNELDANILRKMIIGGANELSAQKDFVDSLNVFPVPDGDTGSNMSMTVLSAAREIENIVCDNISQVAKLASMGALKGARGNSGVILSQLFRGFAKGLDNLKIAQKEDIAFGFMKATEMAYRAVMKPKEGTILTIARELAEKIEQEILESDDLEKILENLIGHGKRILKKTKEMLPQLKQADVVDSGAMGLILILEGALKAMRALEDIKIEKNISQEKKINNKAQASFSLEEIKFGYCTEVLVELKENSLRNKSELEKKLSELGDSLVLIDDLDFIKIHVHTNEPCVVLEKAMDFCKDIKLMNIKIENMKHQHSDILNKNNNLETSNLENKNNSDLEKSDLEKNKIVDLNENSNLELKKIGFVVISSGEGFQDLLKNLGADVIIHGGQTMNPSIEDIVAGIKKINSNEIYILPNNKNIILAAQQAAELCVDKKVFVLESKFITQGIAALINYLPDAKNKLEIMQEAMSRVKTGQVTYAIRDTKFNNKKINKHDILCLLEDEIILVEKNLELAVKKLIDIMLKNNGEVMSIYYGKEIDKNFAQKVFDYVKEKYKNLEIELHEGAQPLYYFIISLE